MLSVELVGLLLTSLVCCICGAKYDLTSLEWLVQNANGTLRTYAKVPTDIYFALFNAKLIDDPYYRDNDVRLRYLSYQNWTFSAKFDLANGSHAAYYLVAEGLDTVSSVFFNDVPIGTSRNMFRTYVFDVSHSKRAIDNELKIEFASPVTYADRLSRLYKRRYGYNVPLDCRPLVAREKGECHANFIRKVESSFGWDWSPTFPTMGIWRGIYVEAFDTCAIRSFSVSPSLIGTNTWLIRADFRLLCTKDLEASFKVIIDAFPFEYARNESSLRKGLNEIRFEFELPADIGARIKLWWPNGYGNQTLYDARGEFRAENDFEFKCLRFGFRTVDLIQDQVRMHQSNNTTDSLGGLTFYFKINGVPVFLKGANWVPADSFLSRVSSDDLSFLVTSMRVANMNAVRINGVGIYEDDEFYRLCDELGILIWHDIMFASNLYPADDEFLLNVRREVEDQVNRLKHHPSIFVWSANNENEWGLRAGWFPLDAPFETYRRDYVRLYNDTVYDAIKSTDPANRPFVLSCPSNGLNTTRSGGVDTDPQSPLFGDIHFYTQYWDAWNWKLYPVARCVTEWGYQSFPSFETLQSAMKPEDLRYFSPQMIHRQHSLGGQMLMLQQIFIQFDFLRLRRATECGTNSGCADGQSLGYELRDLIYLNQIHHAMAYKTAAEHFRRWRSHLNETSGQGLTMCALYWQLNDIWQGQSLSGIDYGMKWKFLHYYARRFFAPVLISPYVDGPNLKISVVSDLTEPLYNCSIVLNVRTWDSFQPAVSYSLPLTVLKPLAAEEIYSASLEEFITAVNPENLHVLFETRLHSAQGSVLAENVLFPDKFYAVPPENYGSVAIKTVTRKRDGVFEIGLRASGGVAPFVWLNVNGIRGYFSDNGFAALAAEVAVEFYAWRNTTPLDAIVANLELTTLRDLYF